jgi:hypothetical protein
MTRCEELGASKGARAVAQAGWSLGKYASGWFRASQATLGRLTGYGETVVRASIRELAALGLLEVLFVPAPSRRRSKLCSEYRLTCGIQLELPFSPPLPPPDQDDDDTSSQICDLVDAVDVLEDGPELVFGAVLELRAEDLEPVATTLGARGPRVADRAPFGGVRSAQIQLELPIDVRDRVKRTRLLIAARELATAPPRREARPPLCSEPRPAAAPPSTRNAVRAGSGDRPPASRGGRGKWVAANGCDCDACHDGQVERCQRAGAPRLSTARQAGVTSLGAALSATRIQTIRSALGRGSKCGPQ